MKDKTKKDNIIENGIEDKVKRNRVIGARGIAVENSNLNAGFDGRPKEFGDGVQGNSDVCTKSADRNVWINSGENVLIRRRLDVDENNNVYSYTLAKTIESVLDSSKSPVIQLLNDFVDVQNFGATIALKGINIGITGVCQYHQGLNKLENTEVLCHPVLSPFSASDNKKKDNKKDKSNESEENEEKKSNSNNIGRHIFVDKALHVQSFSVNPANLNNMVECFKNGEFTGYKEKYYQLFKKAVLSSYSLQSTRTKAGCYDEFSIFINLKEDSMFHINDVGRFIDVILNDDKTVTIDFTKLEFLNGIDDVDSIEIYHNTLSSKIIHNFNKVEVKDLLRCY